MHNCTIPTRKSVYIPVEKPIGYLQVSKTLTLKIRLTNTQFMWGPGHTNPDIFETVLCLISELAFRPHETSESAHWNRIFFETAL